jgi:hypothetical protein
MAERIFLFWFLLVWFGLVCLLGRGFVVSVGGVGSKDEGEKASSRPAKEGKKDDADERQKKEKNAPACAAASPRPWSAAA